MSYAAAVHLKPTKTVDDLIHEIAVRKERESPKAEKKRYIDYVKPDKTPSAPSLNRSEMLKDLKLKIVADENSQTKGKSAPSSQSVVKTNKRLAKQDEKLKQPLTPPTFDKKDQLVLEPPPPKTVNRKPLKIVTNKFLKYQKHQENKRQKTSAQTDSIPPENKENHAKNDQVAKKPDNTDNT